MALRRSSTGQQVVHAGLETTADARFEPHLPRLALFCLRFTQDKEQAAALAERVLRKAGSEIALSRGADDISGRWLYSILREECRISFRAKSAVAAAGPRRRAAEEVF